MMRIYAFLAGAMLLAMLGGTFWMTTWRGDGDFAHCRGSAVAGGTAAIGGPFTLIDKNGDTVTDADIMTKPSLVYFGYTFCPDVCPLDAARNAEALDLLKDQGFDAQAIFITIDPERDTPQVIGEYAGYMHDDMIGLTGSAEQIKAVSRAYKTYYKKQESDDEFYLMDHSTQTYLMAPEHGFLEFFRRSDTPEKIAEKTACYLNAL